MNTLCYLDADSGSIISYFFWFLVIGLAVFFIMRSLLLWYWKVNVIVRNQEEQTALLKQLLEKLTPAGEKKSIDPNTTLKPTDLTIFFDEKKNHGFICSEKDLSSGTMWPNAKNICATHHEGGFHDWKLPNEVQINLIYEHFYKNGIGEFSNGCYWSSVEFGLYDATQYNFSNGIQSAVGKSSLNCVRAIRSF